MRGLQTEAVDVGDEDEQSSELLTALDDTELGRLLDRIDRVAAGIGETDDLRLGSLCLQQEGGEIRRIERRPDLPQDLATGFLDHLCGVPLEGMAKGVIRGDKEPGIAAGLDDRATGAVSQRHGIVGPVDRGRRAGLAGQVRGSGAGNQEHLALVARDLLDREGNARSRHVDDRVDPVIAEPLIGDRRADIGLVLVVGADQLDLLAVDAAAEIGDRHPRRLDRPRASDIGVEAGHVIEHADLDDITRHLGEGRGGQRQDGGKAKYSGKFHWSSFWGVPLVSNDLTLETSCTDFLVYASAGMITV